MAEPKEAYYYASGSRILLEPDQEYIALDANPAREIDSSSKARVPLPKSARQLRGNIFLVPKADLSEDAETHLRQEGSIQPVYLCDGARLIVLPEVRAEDPSPTARARIRGWVEAQKNHATIVEERGDRVVLRPNSGSGNDALQLANRMYEELAPEMVQVRMIRVLPKP